MNSEAFASVMFDRTVPELEKAVILGEFASGSQSHQTQEGFDFL